MKLATVYYTGDNRRHSRRGPSGERYNWSRGTHGASDTPASVESVKDALHFAGLDVFRVEWTGVGRVAKMSQALEEPADGISSMLSDMGYRQKQALAKNLGLKAGGKEEELDARLRPEVEKLQEQMESEL
jgi:hypothetical protein